MSDTDQEKLQAAIENPRNLGEMKDADAVGTVGSPECGDMVRMWLKFKEEDGRKVIDRASFQSFGCQTAIAVASVATEMLAGKSVEEAKSLSSEELSSDLGALPPMKIHCGQLVESALKDALSDDDASAATPENASKNAPETLMDAIGADTPKKKGKIKIVKLD